MSYFVKLLITATDRRADGDIHSYYSAYTTRYDSKFNVYSKAECDQLNLAELTHGKKNH